MHSASHVIRNVFLVDCAGSKVDAPPDPKSVYYDPQVYAHVDELSGDVKPSDDYAAWDTGESTEDVLTLPGVPSPCAGQQVRPEEHVVSGPGDAPPARPDDGLPPAPPSDDHDPQSPSSGED